MITVQLREILPDARTRNRGRYVVSYRRGRVKSIRVGAAAAPPD
jgi:hypothetical protein